MANVCDHIKLGLDDFLGVVFIGVVVANVINIGDSVDKDVAVNEKRRILYL